MRSLRHEEARLALLPDLPAGHEGALLHLLTCPSRQAEIAARLRDSHDDPRGESPQWGLREAGGDPAFRNALRRAHAARERFAALQALPAAEQLRRVQEDPGPSVELLTLLVERAREAQPDAPESSLWLCRLAFELAGRLFRKPSGGAEKALWHARVEGLRGNAERLLGHFDEAGAAFNRAAAQLAAVPERTPADAELCRWRGALVWELGYLEEAEALLRQSSRLFGEVGPPDEEGASRVLLGLLVSERGEWGRAARLLEAGRATLDAARWPWLAVQARCGLALEYVRLGQYHRVDGLLDARTPEEQALAGDTRVGWLEGQVRIRMGQHKEGEKLLRSAWCGFLAQDDGARAALCTLDLAASLIWQRRAGEVGKLVETLAAGFRGDPAIDLLCERARKAMAQGELVRLFDNRGVAEEAAFVRCVLRSQGHRVLLGI